MQFPLHYFIEKQPSQPQKVNSIATATIMDVDVPSEVRGEDGNGNGSATRAQAVPLISGEPY